MPLVVGMHFKKSSKTDHEWFDGKHRFEHWYRDNTVYFITAKVREGAHLFRAESARQVVWDRFNFYSAKHGYVPWVSTLMSNHYHTLGYQRDGSKVGEFMRQFHGSVAWMVISRAG